MNKIERVRAVLHGEMPDRVPVSFWFHFPEEEQCGKAAVEAHLEYFRQADLDFLKIMNEHHYRSDLEIINPSDWRSLRPAPLSSDFYQSQLDEIKMITDELGGECLTVITVFNPYASGNHASDGLVTEHLRADSDSVNIGLRVIAESLSEFAAACLNAGADGIYFAAQGGEEERFEERIFTEIIKSHDLTVLDAVDGKADFNVVHICGDNIRLHQYSDYPGDVINWAATAQHNIPLAAGRKLFGRAILGGLDNSGVIVDGTPEEIEKAVQEVIASFGIRGLFLGADCTLPKDINIENIRIAVEAAAKYGSVIDDY
jgi:uroporphyrinogen decarboxylase